MLTVKIFWDMSRLVLGSLGQDKTFGVYQVGDAVLKRYRCCRYYEMCHDQVADFDGYITDSARHVLFNVYLVYLSTCQPSCRFPFCMSVR